MDTFTVLAESTRRSIVEMIVRRGALTATEISDQFDSSPPAISQHLKVLRDADILRVEKRGRQRIYQLNAAALDEIDEWVSRTKELWNARFDRLERILSLETAKSLNAAKQSKTPTKGRRKKSKK